MPCSPGGPSFPSGPSGPISPTQAKSSNAANNGTSRNTLIMEPPCDTRLGLLQHRGPSYSEPTRGRNGPPCVGLGVVSNGRTGTLCCGGQSTTKRSQSGTVLPPPSSPPQTHPLSVIPDPLIRHSCGGRSKMRHWRESIPWGAVRCPLPRRSAPRGYPAPHPHQDLHSPQNRTPHPLTLTPSWHILTEQ